MTTNTSAIITGGGSGLGFATANHLISKGIHCSILDLKEGDIAKLEDKYKTDHFDFYSVDITSSEGASTVVDAIAAKREIRLLVNCAGIAPAKRILDRTAHPSPLPDFSKVINVNLIGSFNLCRLAAAKMAENSPQGESQERGLIVNTASVAGYEGQIGQCAYSASKGGIIGMTLPMARDLAPLGIRVNTIAPGVMGTSMLLAMPEKVQSALVHNVQFPKRLGQPNEFGMLVSHLLDNHYINGETIRLDGALRMPPK